jgi:hypothetical protein
MGSAMLRRPNKSTGEIGQYCMLDKSRQSRFLSVFQVQLQATKKSNFTGCNLLGLADFEKTGYESFLVRTNPDYTNYRPDTMGSG